MMTKTIKLNTLFLLLSMCSYAQVKKDSIARLSLAARYTGHEVRLRWAPARAGTWALLNRTGYVLERYDVSPNGERINGVRLSVNPIKPEPLENWKRFAGAGHENDYALIAAQALYGKKFTSGNSSLVQQADELTNRYSFTLLSADLDFETAKAAGLGFSDSTAEAGKKYYYKLGAAGKLTGFMPVDTVFELVSTHQIVPISKPVWRGSEEKEHQVILSWDKDIHASQFTAYIIERSTDGKSYTRLNTKPYINMASDLEDKPVFTYADSVGNYIPYNYRLRGITPFGEESPVSEPVRAMGRDRTPPAQPQHVQARQQAGGKVNITWEATTTGDLAGFYVGRSTDPLIGFKPLFEKPLPVATRSYVDESPAADKANYYLVIAADTANNATASLSVFSAFKDSIPPVPPKGLIAKIDTGGIMTLRWNPNKESDIKGYVVLYANQRDHDFTAAVREAISDTIFTDTLRLWTLSEKIYYKVKAVDKNDNTSEASEMLEVSKPDIVPPVNPVFSKYRFENKTLSLEWIPSSSTDVLKHILKRKDLNSGVFKEVATLGRNNQTFTDTTVKSDQKYEYQLVAVDDAGLYSTKPPTLQVRIPDYTGQAGVAGFKASYNTTTRFVELAWNKPAGSKGVTIYRAVEEASFQNIGSVKGDTTVYFDKNAKPGVTYYYTSRVNYANGESSPFSETVKLSF